MPIQLRILAIILAAFFFIYTIRLVRKDRAEIRHMLKWFILALILLIGSIIQIWVQVLHTCWELEH